MDLFRRVSHCVCVCVCVCAPFRTVGLKNHQRCKSADLMAPSSLTLGQYTRLFNSIYTSDKRQDSSTRQITSQALMNPYKCIHTGRIDTVSMIFSFVSFWIHFYFIYFNLKRKWFSFMGWCDHRRVDGSFNWMRSRFHPSLIRFKSGICVYLCVCVCVCVCMCVNVCVWVCAGEPSDNHKSLPEQHSSWNGTG